MPSTSFQQHHCDALDPQRWQLVTSLFAGDIPPKPHARMQRWVDAHRDRHAHIEVMLALSGSGWYGLHDQLYRTRPGTLMLFDVHEPHQCGYPDFAAEQEHLWISVVPTHFTARLLQIGGGRGIRATAWTIVCDQVDAGVCLDRWAFGHAGVQGVLAPVRRARLLATVSGMVVALRESWRHRRAPEDLHAYRARILKTIREHIESTAGNGVTLAGLARIAGYSRFHLHRLFREYYGETIQEYIDICRRRRVAALLTQGLSKKQIAVDLGFSCPAAFSRWLRDKG